MTVSTNEGWAYRLKSIFSYESSFEPSLCLCTVNQLPTTKGWPFSVNLHAYSSRHYLQQCETFFRHSISTKSVENCPINLTMKNYPKLMKHYRENGQKTPKHPNLDTKGSKPPWRHIFKVWCHYNWCGECSNLLIYAK